MTQKYYVANSIQMDKRKKMAEEFYTSTLDPEEIPFIITDDASLYDIYLGDELELIQKINEQYGVNVDISYFTIPFWQFLDFLERNRQKK